VTTAETNPRSIIGGAENDKLGDGYAGILKGCSLAERKGRRNLSVLTAASNTAPETWVAEWEIPVVEIVPKQLAGQPTPSPNPRRI
jgi:hypothetical protein